MEVEGTSVEPRDPRLCTAHNRAGAPCGKFSMKGQAICRSHGGASPQARAKAERMVELATLRLRGLAPRAVSELEDLLTEADSESVRLAAARDLIDRGVCGKAVERPSRSSVRGEQHRRRVELLVLLSLRLTC